MKSIEHSFNYHKIMVLPSRNQYSLLYSYLYIVDRKVNEEMAKSIYNQLKSDTIIFMDSPYISLKKDPQQLGSFRCSFEAYSRAPRNLEGDSIELKLSNDVRRKLISELKVHFGEII